MTALVAFSASFVVALFAVLVIAMAVHGLVSTLSSRRRR